MSEKTYRYTEVANITKEIILFKDGHIVNLAECAARWSEAKGISSKNYSCIGDRDQKAYTPYFEIYSKPVIRIVFTKKGLMWNNRNEKEFEKMRSQIGSLGWTLRDIS